MNARLQAESSDAVATPAAPPAPVAPVEIEPGWRAAAWRVARIAALHADAVDRDARFPREAFDALKRERLMSALVPERDGGAALPLRDVAAICEILAHGCASAAMIYAMHQIQVSCIAAHGGDAPWQRDLLARLAAQQWLLASATSEANIGGNTRTSACAVEQNGSRFRVEKLATTISYGAHADGLLITARRNGEAPASDQVLVVALREQMLLADRGTWDTLGMRGTCSEGARVIAAGDVAQILPAPFAEISDQTMQPVSHMLWSAVWTGIAADALDRAKAFFRAQTRGKPGAVPPAGLRLAEAAGLLQMMQARIAAALDAADRARRIDSGADAPLAAMLGFASDMNTLKTSISQTALRVVHEALMICGMAGYRNGTEYSVGRHLRDLCSAPLMINNDRIAQNTASLLLAQRPAVPGSL